ncbi:MAG: divergent polysaccharide deacetylase family protein [Candidatus Binatia bacterium]
MRGSRSRRRGWGGLARLLFSCSLGALLFLCTVLVREHGRSPMGAVPAPHPNWAADFPARIDAVTKALEGLPWPLPAPAQYPQGAGTLRWIHRRYDLVLPRPAESDAIARTLAPIRSAAPGVTLHVTQRAAGAQVQIGIEGLLTHTLAVHWLGRHPRAAVIIDDLGNDLRIARELASIEAPLTFAVMPFRPFSKEVAELAALLGREVLLHVPMEADSGQAFGARDILRVNAGRADVLSQLDRSLGSVPHAVGVSNHMGSRFTSDRAHMLWVLRSLKERGLFFVDSRTTPNSVACEVAAAMDTPCAARDLFLDDRDEEAAIAGRLRALRSLARTRGDVIAIGHARAATLAALRTAVPRFRAAGVEIVPVSTIIADQSLSPR